MAVKANKRKSRSTNEESLYDRKRGLIMILMLLVLFYVICQVGVSALVPTNTRHNNSHQRYRINNGLVNKRRKTCASKLDSSNLPDNDSSSPSHDDLTSFCELMSPVSSAQPDQMSASSLAYLGDVVFELFIRSRYVWPSRRMPQLQNTVVSLVNAEAQSKLLQKFVDDFKLTSAEQGVLARGRNASLTARKKGKGGESMYQDSTAFEALIGYTYISDKVRFNEMISWVRDELDKMDGV
ncbi:hypothetical protein ACHAWC_004619 [Mediolabrus comicus]